jgi:hypothetical protein
MSDTLNRPHFSNRNISIVRLYALDTSKQHLGVNLYKLPSEIYRGKATAGLVIDLFVTLTIETFPLLILRTLDTCKQSSNIPNTNLTEV